ncbi:MAG: Pycsar system effector family protein [Ilumatobacter sp.]|uniref:Pycsar system effector family protein n=1 Tax=Ilumatobacter sp. TaxID=1967498 RepID=UPI00391CB9D8
MPGDDTATSLHRSADPITGPELDPIASADIEPRSSVDYAFRSLHQSLIQLSGMADQKANIVLGASLIMITIIVGIASSSGITASLGVLGAFAVASSVCALLAVMPSTGANPHRRLNPFYFGDIAYLDEDEYRHLAEVAMRDDGALYSEMLRDIGQQARVLQHSKFRYLRWSYGLFIVGLLATSVAVAVEWIVD